MVAFGLVREFQSAIKILSRADIRFLRCSQYGQCLALHQPLS